MIGRYMAATRHCGLSLELSRDSQTLTRSVSNHSANLVNLDMDPESTDVRLEGDLVDLDVYRWIRSTKNFKIQL